MKPAPFDYRDPRQLDEALTLLDEHGDDAAVLAGGQSLLPLMNLRLARPAVVVDINRIPDLDLVEMGEENVTLGALCRGSALERHEELGHDFPVIREALRYVGFPQIRNRMTAGGSLAYADPAAELPAVMAALDASVVLTSKRGQRSVMSSEFVRGPHATVIGSDELITSVHVPMPLGMRFAFIEATRRQALVGVCVGLRQTGGEVAEARIALCGVGSRPLRLRGVEATLAGEALDATALASLHQAIRDATEAVDDVAADEYRRHVAATLVCRTMTRLWDGSAA